MRTLSHFDLDREEAVLLPEREAMSFLPSINVDIKIVSIQAMNTANAFTIGGLGSSATAIAAQSIAVFQ